MSSNCCDVFGKEINGSLSDRPVLVQDLVDVQVGFRLTHHRHIEEQQDIAEGLLGLTGS